MAVGPNPTVRRRRLGIELRRLREAASLSLDDAGRQLERTGATISRIETGRVGVRARDVEALLDLYEVTDKPTREALLTIARESRQRGWWYPYSDVLPPWFEVYIGLEAEAASIRTWALQVVPGLLQTEDYAHAVFTAGLNDAPDEIERQVALRMARQAILTKDDPPHLWAILDESVLRRRVGGPRVMRDQLNRLVEASALRHVTLQVLPFAAGAYKGMTGPFVLLGFPGPPSDPVVYLEHLGGSLYLEKAAEAARYTLTFDHLRAAAVSPSDSLALIASVAKEY